tara:strand:- start:520 stop:930 length:411 start_codon:yes stop_codon:yes gene_type:complete
MAILEGALAYDSKLTTTDVYQGQDTGKYVINLVLSDEDAEALKAKGVNIKEGNIRKLASGYANFIMKDSDGEIIKDAEDPLPETELGKGSVVRVSYALGKPNAVYGSSLYFNGVRVISAQPPYDADNPRPSIDAEL